MANTSAPAAAPTFVSDVQNTGMPGIDGGTLMLWHAPQVFDGAPTLRVDRHVGGTVRESRLLPASILTLVNLQGYDPFQATTTAVILHLSAEESD